jgi:hypothetical protein
MTLQPKFVAAGMRLAAVLVIVAAAMIVAGAVENALLISPTPETESTFFRAFTPDDVVKRFACRPGWGEGGQSAGAGIGYTTHEKHFDQSFAIHASDWVPMIGLLQEEVSSQLLAEGAQIRSESRDFSEGFRIHYKSGTSVGVIDVEPLKTLDPDTLGPQGVCKGGIAVQLKVSMQEKWYKNEPKTAAELTLHPS